MKLNEQPFVPIGTPTALRQFLFDSLQSIARQVNGLSGGSFTVINGTATTAPTTGTWARGDKIRNSAPTELGSASSKYVIDGWICTVAGTPGTWLEQRTLTGN